MAVILFDMFPAHGHYNGSLGLALKLKKSGHSVYYACSGDFQQKVHSRNIDSYIINPFIIPPSNSELKEKGLLRFAIESIIGLFQNNWRQEIDKNVKSYDTMIERLKPDLILIDELHFSYKSIFYWKYKIQTATVQTAISSDFDPAVPPFVSTYVPNNSKINNIYIAFLWNRYFVKRKLKSLLNNFNIISKSSRKIFSYYSKLYDFPYKENVIKRRLLGIRFKHIPSLVTPPEAFDFPRIHKNNLFFMGPIHTKSESKQKVEGRLKSVIDNISRDKVRNPHVKLIYCSLGTVSVSYLKICTKFFNHIAHVCDKNSDFRIILSVGTFFNISDISSIPQNLYVFDNVPQSALLVDCDMVINHGGINTIVECIMAEKPMITYPLSLDWDQPGCAARVVYNNIGVKGVIRRATPKSIERLLNRIIDQEDFYVDNVKKLKSKFVDKSSYTQELIDRIIKEGKSC